MHPSSSKHDIYFTKKAQTNHTIFWIKLWLMQWMHIKFTVASLQLCGCDTGCSVPFPPRCHMSSGSINDFRWTPHTDRHAHVHFGQPKLPATVPCRSHCGLLPNPWPMMLQFQWMLPELLEGQCEVHVLSTQVSAKIRAVKWNLLHPFKCNRSQ